MAPRQKTTRGLTAGIDELNKNIQYNTNQVSKLRTEIKISRAVDEQNQKFLQDIIKQLIKDKTDEKKAKRKATTDITQKRLALAKSIVEWAIRIGAIVVLGAFGVNELLPS